MSNATASASAPRLPEPSVSRRALVAGAVATVLASSGAVTAAPADDAELLAACADLRASLAAFEAADAHSDRVSDKACAAWYDMQPREIFVTPEDRTFGIITTGERYCTADLKMLRALSDDVNDLKIVRGADKSITVTEVYIPRPEGWRKRRDEIVSAVLEDDRIFADARARFGVPAAEVAFDEAKARVKATALRLAALRAHTIPGAIAKANAARLAARDREPREFDGATSTLWGSVVNDLAGIGGGAS